MNWGHLGSHLFILHFRERGCRNAMVKALARIARCSNRRMAVLTLRIQSASQPAQVTPLLVSVPFLNMADGNSLLEITCHLCESYVMNAVKVDESHRIQLSVLKPGDLYEPEFVDPMQMKLLCGGSSQRLAAR